MQASTGSETLALGDDDPRPPRRPWATYAVIVAILIAACVNLWPERSSPQPDTLQEPPASAVLRYRGVELEVSSSWLEQPTTDCPPRDSARVGRWRDLQRSTACPAGSRGTVVLLAPFDRAAPPEESIGEAADGRTYAQRLVPERGVVLSVATYDSVLASRLLASLRVLRQGDIVNGCPAAALKLPVERDAFGAVAASPTRVRGATVCSYAGAWLGAVKRLDAAQAQSLVRTFATSAPPPRRRPCGVVYDTASTSNWLTYLDTTPGTTALLVLQRCPGVAGGAVLVTGEPTRASTEELWRELVAVAADNGLTPTYP